MRITADRLLSMKSPPALIYNSLILLCPRNHLFILIGCFSLALPNDAYSPMAMADDGAAHLLHSLVIIASLFFFPPLSNKPRGFLSSMILISFHLPQSEMRRRLRLTFFFFTMSLYPIPPSAALPLSLHDPNGMPALMHF